MGCGAARRLADDDRLWLSRSWTTRPRREGEAEDAYVFVDRERFRARAEAGAFLEWFEVYGNLYGTPVPEAPPGRDILLEIDLQGAGEVKARFPDAFMVFVRPPSRAEQERRLRARGDGEEDVRRRLAKGDAEEEQGLRMADHVVVNDDLDRAVAEVTGAIGGARTARSG